MTTINRTAKTLGTLVLAALPLAACSPSGKAESQQVPQALPHILIRDVTPIATNALNTQSGATLLSIAYEDENAPSIAYATTFNGSGNYSDMNDVSSAKTLLDIAIRNHQQIRMAGRLDNKGDFAIWSLNVLGHHFSYWHN